MQHTITETTADDGGRRSQARSRESVKKRKHVIYNGDRIRIKISHLNRQVKKVGKNKRSGIREMYTKHRKLVPLLSEPVQFIERKKIRSGSGFNSK